MKSFRGLLSPGFIEHDPVETRTEITTGMFEDPVGPLGPTSEALEFLLSIKNDANETLIGLGDDD